MKQCGMFVIQIINFKNAPTIYWTWRVWYVKQLTLTKTSVELKDNFNMLNGFQEIKKVGGGKSPMCTHGSDSTT